MLDVLHLKPQLIQYFKPTFVCLSVQAQSQRSVGSVTLRPTACPVLVVSVNLDFRGTAPIAVQSHVSVLQLRMIHHPEILNFDKMMWQLNF